MQPIERPTWVQSMRLREIMRQNEREEKGGREKNRGKEGGRERQNELQTESSKAEVNTNRTQDIYMLGTVATSKPGPATATLSEVFDKISLPFRKVVDRKMTAKVFKQNTGQL